VSAEIKGSAETVVWVASPAYRRPRTRIIWRAMRLTAAGNVLVPAIVLLREGAICTRPGTPERASHRPVAAPG
jgi:hypothetical protein